jgi:hypothetical protein
MEWPNQEKVWCCGVAGDQIERDTYDLGQKTQLVCARMCV